MVGFIETALYELKLLTANPYFISSSCFCTLYNTLDLSCTFLLMNCASGILGRFSTLYFRLLLRIYVTGIKLFFLLSLGESLLYFRSFGWRLSFIYFCACFMVRSVFELGLFLWRSLCLVVLHFTDFEFIAYLFLTANPLNKLYIMIAAPTSIFIF